MACVLSVRHGYGRSRGVDFSCMPPLHSRGIQNFVYASDEHSSYDLFPSSAICFVFCYTSWHFYAFSGTNLLTRCHSASSLFFAIFVFQKSYTRNILGIGRNKSRTSYFYRSFAETEDETEGGQGPGSPWGGAAQLLAAPPHGEATRPTS
jgi:hypothetical protein